MIVTDPRYVFKGTLAGVCLFFMSFAIIAASFPVLSLPVAILAFGLFVFRCRCAYWDRRFSNYALLILSLHLLMAPLFSATLIAMLVGGKLNLTLSILATMAPLVSHIPVIAICAKKASLDSPFRVFKGRVVLENVQPSGSRWWALLGGIAALFGSYAVGKNHVQLVVALMVWAVGIYIVIYFRPAIRGLLDLRRLERSTGQYFEFDNQEALDALRARSIIVRLVTAVRDQMVRNRKP